MTSIAITSYNRSDLTIESFSKVYDHPLVSEIVIVDDASEQEHWVKLLSLIDNHPATNKIKVYRNEKNLGMKVEALNAPAPKDAPGESRRRVIDTTLPGLSNQGHPFGFNLSEKEKRQVIEYLKTL